MLFETKIRGHQRIIPCDSGDILTFTIIYLDLPPAGPAFMVARGFILRTSLVSMRLKFATLREILDVLSQTFVTVIHIALQDLMDHPVT